MGWAKEKRTRKIAEKEQRGGWKTREHISLTQESQESDPKLQAVQSHPNPAEIPAE
jgi:hypothetical protein